MKKVRTDFILNLSNHVFLKQVYVFAVISSHGFRIHAQKKERRLAVFNSEKQ